MTAGQHHRVAFEKIEAFAVEIFVRVNVKIDALLLQPVRQMQVAVELPQ